MLPCNLKTSVPQESFREYFNKEGHCGMNGCNSLLLIKLKTWKDSGEKRRFGNYRLDSFVPNGLNERDVTLY